MELQIGARTLLGAPGHTSRNKKLLRAPGLTTRNKKLLGAPGIATRSKEATSNKYFTILVDPLDLTHAISTPPLHHAPGARGQPAPQPLQPPGHKDTEFLETMNN